MFNPVFLSESCSWAGFKSIATAGLRFVLQEPSQTQLKSKVPTRSRRRLWFAICRVRVLEPKQIRRSRKILAPPAQEQTCFGDDADGTIQTAPKVPCGQGSGSHHLCLWRRRDMGSGKLRACIPGPSLAVRVDITSAFPLPLCGGRC